jgi:protein-S-isoprenylcysteine O-methyltransferase Ste14
MTPEVKRGVVRYVLKEYFGVLFLALLFRGATGRWDVPSVWAVLAIYLGWVTATVAVIAPRSPGLLAERAQRTHASTKGWDRWLLGLFGLETLARYVVAGLDLRFGWTGPFPLALAIFGFVLSALGFALVTWSMAANAWFSTVVRLQPERGQRVADGGPYAWVRHPGYVGTCGFELGTGLVLGSWPAFALGVLGVILLVVRTALEDRTLRAELEGYEAYAQRVRFRLVPGVW